MLGRFITGLQGVRYSAKQDKGYVYGVGNEPRAIQHGNRTYDGYLRLLQSELEALVTSAPNKDLLSLQFDISVSYHPKDANSRIVTDVLKYCEFREVPKQLNQNDTLMEVELPILFLGLQPQA